MAVTRTFGIRLYKAKREGAFISIELDIGGRNNLPDVKIEASTTAEGIAVAERLAREYGGPCNAGIRVVQGRKPPGFDAATRGLSYNMDAAQPAAA